MLGVCLFACNVCSCGPVFQSVGLFFIYVFSPETLSKKQCGNYTLSEFTAGWYLGQFHIVQSKSADIYGHTPGAVQGTGALRLWRGCRPEALHIWSKKGDTCTKEDPRLPGADCFSWL